MGLRLARARTVVAGLALAAAVAVLTPAAAFAADPVDLGAAVTDQAGALTSAERTTVGSALSSASSAVGGTVDVVFVDTFSNPGDAQQWATTTAQRSGLGSGDIVLAIAVQSRQYGFARSTDFALSRSEVQQVVDDDVRPQLRDSDWAAGATAFANGLRQAEDGAGSTGTDSDGTSGGTASTAQSSAGSGLGVVVLIVVVLAAVLIVVAVLRRRRRAAAGAGASGTSPVGPPPVDQKELDARSSRDLIGLDDALTASDQELGFAQAEFGEQATAGFTTALATARDQAKQAFALRQQLDDEIPETPDQRREMTERIIQLCGSARSSLDAQKAAFDDLRKLEQQLPAGVQAAGADRERLQSQAARAASTLDGLRSQYGEDAVRGAADDLDQAQQLLQLAGSALDDAAPSGRGPTGTSPQVSSGEASGGAAGGATATATGTGASAVALRAAQQSIAQAATLLQGITAAPEEFMATKRRLDAAVADTRSDIAEAQAATARAGDDSPAIDAAVRDARSAIEGVDTQAPPVALTAVEQANTALDRVLGRVRDRDAQLQRAAQTLPRVLDAAERSVDATRRYIDSRRGGVGADARTRITEAQRQFDLAVQQQQSDPVAALTAAQTAQARATEAYELAQQDVDDFRGGRGPFGGGGLGGGGLGGGGGGGVVAGALLAGVLGGVLSGGGRGGGWGGGSGWGGDVGGGWGGGGWGGGDSGGGGGFDGGGGDFGGGGDSGGGGGF